MAEIYQLPENGNSNSGFGNIPFSIPIGGFGGGLFGNGNHELYHATTAIIDYYGEPYDQEPAAYLQGELMRLAVEEIGEPCR